MSVPVLDVTDWHTPGHQRDRLAKALGESLERYGFVSCVGHGVDDTLLERAYASAAEVFALPLEVKTAHETPDDGRQRGYTSFGIEHARDQPVADLKEFWHVGRASADLPGVPVNRFPHQVPAFQAVMTELFGALDTFASHLLGAVAAYLELPHDYFVSRVRGGNSLLRVIHYPPLDADRAVGAVRAAAHEDVNLVTVLPASTAPGLELLTREGRWLPVQPPAGAMICDTGDMMALVTRTRLPATTHRVVNPDGPYSAQSRFALPFFVHPRPDVALNSTDGTITGPTSAEFLAHRLREIGLA